MEARLISLEVKVDGLTKSVERLTESIEFLEQQIMKTYFTAGREPPENRRGGLALVREVLRGVFLPMSIIRSGCYKY